MTLWILGGFALLALALIVLGIRATNEPGQPADVRMGGVYPIALGLLIPAVDAVAALIYAVVT